MILSFTLLNANAEDQGCLISHPFLFFQIFQKFFVGQEAVCYYSDFSQHRHLDVQKQEYSLDFHRTAAQCQAEVHYVLYLTSERFNASHMMLMIKSI